MRSRGIVAFCFFVNICTITLAGCQDRSTNAQAIFSDPKVAHLAKAAETGDVDSIEKLVMSGVEVNSLGRGRITPLYYAFIKKNESGFQSLLKNGANPNILTSNGICVMHEAASDANSFWLEESLKHTGDSNVLANGNNTKKWTPIFFAINNRRPENARLLIKNGADINHKNDRKTFPLLFSAQCPCFEIVYLLVESGADVRQKNSANDDLITWIQKRNENDVVEDDERKWFKKTAEQIRSKGIELKFLEY